MVARVTKARARRVVARADLKFKEYVADPRDARGRRHAHHGLLKTTVVALMAGSRTLRQVEELAADVGASSLDLRTVPSDSTVYRLLQAQSPDGFREVLHDQLRRDIDSKAIRNDLFPGGILTVDGKGAGSGYGKAPNPWCRSTVCDDEGTKVWHLYTLRASLTSSSATPYLDQAFLDDKTGETTEFSAMFTRVVARFPRLFQYVTGDAEFTSAKNANQVIAAGKNYVFGLKANRRRLYDMAKGQLEAAPVRAVTTETYRGCEVRRELRRVSCPADVGFPGAQQFWSVRRVATDTDGLDEVEERIFITSTSWNSLTPKRILQLVRLHWRIENNGNWTADLIFGDDQPGPCQTGNGVVALSWLRLLALNLVAVFRAHLPCQDRAPVAWRRAIELVRLAFVISGCLGGQLVSEV